ncbi:MAG: N-6 DNA methylase [Spirochaetales bacterium]|nr:N-6 DNA methylase [Spirochaetales bacterium]
MIGSDLLTAAQTAQLIGISKASILNWERHEYLTKQDGGYRKSEVLSLLEKIQSGEIDRLNRRANKKKTAGTISPAAEYRVLCDAVSKIELDGPELMFLLSLKQFIDSGQVSTAEPIVLLDFNPNNYGSKVVFSHLRERFMQLELTLSPGFTAAASAMMRIDLPKLPPSETDIAGIIYQAVRQRGDRSVSGSFYTPADISASMIASAMRGLKTDNPLFVDPCCGTGQFMLSFIAAGGSPERTYGMDSDSTAAFMAASNILLECPDIDFQPKVFACDSLLQPPEGFPSAFDITATNPPWGACNSAKRAELEKRFPMIKSGESFSYFISRAFELSSIGGMVSLVLPESITNVRMHKDVRELILDRSRITKVRKLGKIFKGVYTPVITLEMLTSPDNPRPADSSLAFNININSNDIKIIDKIYSVPHFTLSGRAEWALGIVTGDNKKYVSIENRPGFEPLIRGGDIGPGTIRPASHFIKFEPDIFQQTAPEWKYRSAEKLVYKFISKKLVFALDRQGTLTLNSANILLPGPGCLPAPLLMQLLNSDIYNFLYVKKFNSVKVLRSNLEELPLPLGVPSEERLTGLFGLTEAEIQYIKNLQL